MLRAYMRLFGNYHWGSIEKYLVFFNIFLSLSYLFSYYILHLLKNKTYVIY